MIDHSKLETGQEECRLKLSTRSRYGLLSIYELAKNQSDSEPLTIKTIAGRWDLSESYLEQLFSSLKKAGLVLSKRGAQGGYLLSRAPVDITIGEVILALEGSTSITDCVDSDACGDTCNCPSRPIFTKLQQSINQALNSMTLQDMLDEPEMVLEEA